MHPEEEDFKRFYHEYYRYVFAVVATYIPHKQDAEDIISEVFISIYKSFDKLDYSENVKAFVFTVTKRRINDFLRKKYKISEFEINVEDIDSIPQQNEAETTLNTTRRDLMSKMVAELDLKYKQLYKYKYKQGLPISQVSEKMGITINYVKVLNNRLIKKLSKLWMQRKIKNK